MTAKSRTRSTAPQAEPATELTEAPECIEFRYKFPDDYNPAYANGAYGGISPHGEIVINFFVERHPVPNAIVSKVNSDGMLGEETTREPKTDHPMMIRYITNGVILDYRTAKGIYEWLGEQLQILEPLRPKS